jgi:hypothetical protein
MKNKMINEVLSNRFTTAAADLFNNENINYNIVSLDKIERLLRDEGLGT